MKSWWRALGANDEAGLRLRMPLARVTAWFMRTHLLVVLATFARGVLKALEAYYMGALGELTMESQRASVAHYAQAGLAMPQYVVDREASRAEMIDTMHQAMVFAWTTAVVTALLAAAMLSYPGRFRGLMLRLFSKKEKLKQWQFVGSVIGSDQCEHLLLGISVEGALRFLEHEAVKMITFVGEGGHGAAGGADGKYKSVAGWAYDFEKYSEIAKASGWLDKPPFAPVARADPADLAVPGARDVVGYHTQQLLQKWVKENGHKQHSACEVILKDPRFAEIAPHVGRSHAFWSHIQGEDLLGEGGTLRNMLDVVGTNRLHLPPGRQQLFFLDYFCLRQAQNDFEVHVVLGLISEIGKIVVSIDPELDYCARSFCILEAYAGVAGAEDAERKQKKAGRSSNAETAGAEGGCDLIVHYNTEDAGQAPSARELVAQQEGALPAGWAERKDDEGNTYDVDHETKTTTWHRPAAPQLNPTQDSSSVTLTVIWVPI